MPEKESELLEISYYGCSDIGLVRIENQDSFGKFPQNDFDLYSSKGQLFIVADGMGGHVGGKEASSTAVDVINREYFNSVSPDVVSVLKKAFEKANSEIFGKSSSSDQYKRMGTTCSLLLLKGQKGYIAHVGDSRIYKIENDKIEQVTDDHTKVQEMLKNGLLTAKEAKNYPSKSILARAMGVEEKVNADFKDNLILKKGQCFILCSDGLAKVSKEEILPIVLDNPPKDACDKLINLANERGGKDNVTVLVIKVDSVRNKEVLKKTPKKKFPFFKLFLTIFLLAFIALGIQYRDKIAETFRTIGGNGETHSNNAVKKQAADNAAKYEGTNYGMLIRADKLYKEGKLESALILYKKILHNEPMHLGALQGVNNIASAYMGRAEKLREQNNFTEALKLYRKVEEIQPKNTRVQKLIEECRIQINNGPPDTNSVGSK